MKSFSPLQRYIADAREGADVLEPRARLALGERLGSALEVELGTLRFLDVMVCDEPPFDFRLVAEVPELGPTERGVAALAAWAKIAEGAQEWHAAWTDGPLLTVDVVLRTPEACAVGRVELRPGAAGA